MPARRPTLDLRPLASAPDTGLAGDPGVDVRLALVWTLTREAWALAGWPMPTYGRAETPVRVLHRPATPGPRP